MNSQSASSNQNSAASSAASLANQGNASNNSSRTSTPTVPGFAAYAASLPLHQQQQLQQLAYPHQRSSQFPSQMSSTNPADLQSVSRILMETANGPSANSANSLDSSLQSFLQYQQQLNHSQQNVSRTPPPLLFPGKSTSMASGDSMQSGLMDSHNMGHMFDYASHPSTPSPGGSPVEMKTTLWMGDLDPWMDENYVKQIWLNYGEHVNVKVIRDKFTGMNAGYCFVDFQSNLAATKALLGLNGTFIPNSNKLFKLNWASGGGLSDKKEYEGPEYSIFVGDLGPDVTDHLLLTTFQSRYPSCRSAKVVTDPVTGLSRGYGFVRFSDEQEQQRSMVEMQGQFCGSRPMRISVATPKSRFGSNYHAWMGTQASWQQPTAQTATASVAASTMMQMQRQPTPGLPTSSQSSMGMMGGNNLSMSQASMAQASQFGMSGLNGYNDPNNTTVFVGGLTGSFVGEEELASHFAPFGPIVYVKIPPGKGCGFVSFVHRSSAENAIAQLNGTLLAGNRIRLSWGRSNASMAGLLPASNMMSGNVQQVSNIAHPSVANWKMSSSSAGGAHTAHHGGYGNGIASAPISPSSSPDQALFNSSVLTPSPSAASMLPRELLEGMSADDPFVWKQDSFYLGLSDAGMLPSRPQSANSLNQMNANSSAVSVNSSNGILGGASHGNVTQNSSPVDNNAIPPLTRATTTPTPGMQSSLNMSAFGNNASTAMSSLLASAGSGDVAISSPKNTSTTDGDQQESNGVSVETNSVWM